MVRHYVSKNMRGQWTEANVLEAVAAVEGGSSLKRASKEFSVPRTTLRRHMKIKVKGGQIKKRLGRPAILSETQELELVDLILDFESRLFGLYSY